MHSKQKGNIGELAIALDLAQKGLPVFKEIGDLSRTDLITIVDSRAIKLQIKAGKLVNGSISIKSTKWGPGYNYTYTKEDIDVFGIYSIDTGDIGYILAKDLLKYKTITFRILNSKNNQTKKTHNLKNYRNFLGILRDYTPNTLTNNVEGDDIVQTTTTI